MRHSIALVTGATSGLGYAAARLLSERGWQDVIVTGRSLAAAKDTAAQLVAGTSKRVFSPLALDLNTAASVKSALADLAKGGRPIDFLLLNAGLVPTRRRVITAEGIEASQAPLIGHHALSVGLLNANLLSPDARIVITSAEPARGGVPMFRHTDLPAFAAKDYRGDYTAAAEALIRSGPKVKYAPNTAYADAKLMIAWWAEALARRLPAGMAVYAVSPGASNATNVARNAGPLLKYLMIPIVNLIPGMNQAPEVAAGRYIQASAFGTDVSGQFFASAMGKFSGPMEVQRQPHLLDGASQEAAWQAVVNVSGVDVTHPEWLRAVSGRHVGHGALAADSDRGSRPLL
ncbi:SDR family NAD(P)-dependent oxidoreductase [Sphingomonas sp. CARO-RG-8B-R24-01]|uniref:SDR family NAD(P)-dependent oxidoreductase n=1 Tax=Sphingomonas sp. CARO-RG-8B-R24-01 TaxID=2914831 RepID=UPI001F5864D7|nr:SDR family NAD(P)-dependent oxidoreductase [Sphingomonas sp. CARO-RG-8B-R24-01]